MIVYVEQLAMGEGKMRPVAIQNKNYTCDMEVLHTVFVSGQNDFQNVPGFYSVSAGDVIWFQSQDNDNQLKFYLISMIGFNIMTFDDYVAYKNLDCDERREYVWKTREYVSS